MSPSRRALIGRQKRSITTEFRPCKIVSQLEQKTVYFADLCEMKHDSRLKLTQILCGHPAFKIFLKVSKDILNFVILE